MARTSDLLRTRVEVATEAQNHWLLDELRRGQASQLRLQETVEALSVVVISYYVVGMLAHVSAAASEAGLPVEPEVGSPSRSRSWYRRCGS